MPDLPEEAVQAATPRLRHGNRNRQNLYQVNDDGSETFVAVAMTPEYAEMIVQRFNATAEAEADIVDRWWRDDAPTRQTGEASDPR